MKRRIEFLKSLALVVVLLISVNFLSAADSRSNPVTATYCDGSTLDVYPYSLVTHDDHSTAYCYDVLVSPISGGNRYGFEDKDDADYDDIVIELTILGNNTSSPVAHIKYISKEASYKHWIYIVYNGSQQLVFRSEDAKAGDTFDIPLPVKNCADYEIIADPVLRTIFQAESTVYTVTVKAGEGFSQDVNLSVEGLPAGTTGVFQPNPLPVTGEAKLNVTTTATTPVGTYRLIIKGAAGEKIRSDEVTLEIQETAPEPDFELNAVPSLQTVDPGDSTSYGITINAINGFSSDVNLSVEGLPAGVSGLILPNPLPATGEAKLDISTTDTVIPGTYSFTLKGTSGENIRTVQLSLKINENQLDPDFTFEAEPKEQSLFPGETVEFELTLTALNGFSKPVNLFINDLPEGVKADIQPGIVQLPVKSVLTFNTTAHAAIGTHSIKVYARGGGIRRDVELTLTIKEIPPDPDFDIKVSPATQTLYRGDKTEYKVSVTAINDFDQEVELQVNGLPSGTTAVFNQSLMTPDNETQLIITTTANTPLGDHVLTVTASSDETEHHATVKLSVRCHDFSFKLSANPVKGAAPLAVQFNVAAEQSGGGDSNSYKYTWNFGDNNTSTIQNPEYTYHVPGTYQATVNVTDGCGKTKTASATIEVVGFDGTISKTFSVTETLAGTEIFFTIQIKNETRYDFTNLSVKDVLSPYLEYLEDDSPVKPQRSGQELVWRFQSLERGETLRFNTKVKVAENTPSGTITNVAILTHDSLGQGKQLTSNTASIQVRNVDVVLQKIVEQTQAKPGDLIKYQLIIKNNSDIPLTGIKLTDELDDHLEYDYQNGSFEFQRQGRNLQWTGTIAAQQQERITLKALVKQETFSGTRIQNKVRLEAAELKTALDSNTVETTISTEPISTTTVQFTKRADIPQAEVGRVIRFSVTIANTSNSGLISPVIEDYLPQGFSYVASTTLLNNQVFSEPQGTRKLLWQLPNINPGETLVLRYQTIIGTDAKRGMNVNRALLRTVDNSGQDINLEANATVSVSSSSFIFYSGVEGTVYLDRDNDDFYSMQDTPLPGIEVRLSTGEKTFTDSLGNFNFESLFPGEYAVGVNTATLPEKYRLASPYPKVVVLADGLNDTVDFAVKFQGDDEEKTARLQGRVFYDKNQNKAFDSNDTLATKFTASLNGELTTTGKEGTFVFSHLKPGTYRIKIIYGPKSLEKEITLEEGKNYIDIPLKFSGIKIIIQGEAQ